MAEEQHAAALLLGRLSGSRRHIEDWAPVLNLASQTLTVSELAEIVLGNEDASGVPPAAIELLSEVRSRTHLRNDRLKRQLAEALPALNSVGVDPIILKGMARVLAGDRNRLISDIDLLVPADAYDRAVQVLATLGYEVSWDSEHSPAALHRLTDCGSIDLHRWVPPAFLHFDYARLRPHCDGFPLGRGRALIPTPTWQLALLVAHDQLHDRDYWRGLIDLRHLLDIMKLSQGEVDWRALNEIFPPGQARRALHVQLRSVRDFLDARIDPEFCGGLWAEIQLARRRYQALHPWLLPLFTLLTILLEPPRQPFDLSGKPVMQKIRYRLRRVYRYLKGPGIGKIQLT